MAGDSIEQQVDKLLTRVDDARSTGLLERREIVEAVVADLRRLCRGTADTLVQYAIGYGLYAHPCRLDEQAIRQGVEESLLKVVAIMPDDGLAWLYLGHNAYDFKDWSLALNRFERVGPHLPRHLLLRAQEMRVCCNIRLTGLAASLIQLKFFVTECELSAKEDIWPVELASCLSESVGQLGQPLLARAQELCARLDAAGHLGTWLTEIIALS